jgi:hypothetical protein
LGPISREERRPMERKMGLASFFLVLGLACSSHLACAQGFDSTTHSRPLITQRIDEAKRVPLAGNTRPETNAANDRGKVADDFPMAHMMLQLKRPPEQEQALQQFIEGLQTKGSANFHQWITAQEFGERFGLAKQDLDAITGWLESHGFTVNVVYPSGMVIDFSGTAGQVREAFQTEIQTHCQHQRSANSRRPRACGCGRRLFARLPAKYDVPDAQTPSSVHLHGQLWRK